MNSRPAILATVILLAACGDPVATDSGDRAEVRIQPQLGGPCTTCSPSVELFSRPFAGDFPAINLFDHSTTTDRRSTFFWGESVPTRPLGRNRLSLDEGHRGYDWKMNEGTPILAVAAGRVVETTNGDPNATCPFAAPQLTQLRRVAIEHSINGVPAFRTIYAHLSSIEVQLGAQVSAGKLVGKSGQTGCARGPHLHFEVWRTTSSGFRPIDPYGWSDASAADPWKTAPGGAESVALWRNGQAPSISLTAFKPSSPGTTRASPAWPGWDRETLRTRGTRCWS